MKRKLGIIFCVHNLGFIWENDDESEGSAKNGESKLENERGHYQECNQSQFISIAFGILILRHLAWALLAALSTKEATEEKVREALLAETVADFFLA